MLNIPSLSRLKGPSLALAILAAGASGCADAPRPEATEVRVQAQGDETRAAPSLSEIVPAAPQAVEVQEGPLVIDTTAGPLNLNPLLAQYRTDYENSDLELFKDLGDGVVLLVIVVPTGGTIGNYYYIVRYSSAGYDQVLDTLAYGVDEFTDKLSIRFEAGGFQISAAERSYWTCEYQFNDAGFPISSEILDNPDSIPESVCDLDARAVVN